MFDPKLKGAKFKKVRLVDESGKNLGIFNLDEAFKIAEERNSGLILISDKADPPVVRLGDYYKYIYNLKKQAKKEKKVELKEIRISFQEAESDLIRKAKNAEEFLKEGHQVRIKMILKGRQLIHIDLAKGKINKILENIEVPYKIVNEITQQGNVLFVILSRK